MGRPSYQELAGSGCVYVRLTKDISYVSGSSSSDEFPPVFTVPRDSSGSLNASTSNAKSAASCQPSSSGSSLESAPSTSRSVVSPICIEDDDD